MVNDVEPTAPAAGAAAVAAAAPAASGARLISALENAETYNVKHPLQHSWSLWLKKADSGKDQSPAAQAATAGLSSLDLWKRQVDDIGSVSTVEDFWW